MSGTVMKFGPQWIRTLTDGAASSSSSTSTTSNNNNNNSNNNNNNSPNNLTTPNNNINSSSSTNPTTNHTSGNLFSSSSSNPYNSTSNNNNGNGNIGKYKLAEYRYGREEMLALFEQDMDSPEDIKKFADLYHEKARMPMAMTQMSEEEVKLSTRNWNSEAVLRSSGKIAANNAASAGLGQGPNSTTGISGSGGLGSNLNDRDNRQLSDRGAPGTLTAAGVLSSSPRGPPGSLARIPLEQRGLLSSLNSRGPSTIRNLVGRGPNLYIRSQSHDDEGLDDGITGTSSGTGGSGFDSRFGLPGQVRQPNSLRTRFETNRIGGTGPGSKPIDIKSGNTIDGELTGERQRSVFDRLSNKYDDKIVRKDINGRPIQSGDWRSREWSGSGLDNRGSKAPAEERSWRSSRGPGAGGGGGTDDWRSNNNSTTSSSWYVRTDDQRNVRVGAPQNQENLNSGFSGKRDTLRRPSVDDRHGDEDDDSQSRHRRDSLPEWSIGDPLSGDKVGSFDATGAFREIAREDGNDSLSKEKSQQDQTGQDIKSSGAPNNEQEWRLKSKYGNSYGLTDARNLNGVNSTNSLSELEKLSLLDRNSVVKRDVTENVGTSNESRSKISDGLRDAQSREIQDRFSDVNFQNSIHNQLTSGKNKQVDLQARTSPPTLTDNEHKKSMDRSRNSVSPQQLVNQSIPANLQQMLKKQQQTNQNQQQQQQQQQSFLSAIASSSNTMQPSNNNEEDGFAHLERAAECMVAEWTAEEEQNEAPSSSQAYFKQNKLNLTREQQDAQANIIQNNTDVRLSNKAQQQQSGPDQPSTANSSVAFDSNNQKKFILLPFNHEDSQQWFYRDTQGVIQGPFSATEMFEWYKAGYFVKELLVRRACDELFYPLGEVIKMWDRIPFAPVPMNVPPPPPITTQALLQFRAVTKQYELAASMNPTQGQIPPNAFGLAHPGTVLLHRPMIQQQQQQQVHQVIAASLNQNISGPQEQQAGIRQILEATRQHDQTMVQQQRAHQGNVLDQNEMQTQLRQLLAQLKNREGFSNLNAQEQQEVLVRQFVASRAMPGAANLQEQERARMIPFLPFFSDQEKFRYQQRLELERRQKEEAEMQGRFIMEQRMKAEEEKQRLMDEIQKQRQRKQKEENEKQRQEAEKERLLQLSQLKQQQLAKQQEEFRQQMQSQQRLQQQQQQQQQEIKQQQVIQLNSIQQQQQQQIERAKKAAQALQVQQEQQRKTAWSTVSKSDQEPVSLATLQKMQEEEKKEKERERMRQIQQQIQSNQQQQQQLQLQRQMTWANAAQQSKAAPIKTLAEIQKEEEERLAKEKQKKTKVQPTVPNAGVWNNAASHLSWKNPPADS